MNGDQNLRTKNNVFKYSADSGYIMSIPEHNSTSCGLGYMYTYG